MKLIIVVFVVVFVVVLPVWPYSRNWGYSSSVGVCFIGLVVMALHRLRAI